MRIGSTSYADATLADACDDGVADGLKWVEVLRSGREVPALPAVVDGPHGLQVLFRHRPRSISQEVPHSTRTDSRPKRDFFETTDLEHLRPAF
jgi:hypothetical protein